MAVEEEGVLLRIKLTLGVVRLAVRHPGSLGVFGMKVSAHGAGFQVNILHQEEEGVNKLEISSLPVLSSMYLIPYILYSKVQILMKLLFRIHR